MKQRRLSVPIKILMGLAITVAVVFGLYVITHVQGADDIVWENMDPSQQAKSPERGSEPIAAKTDYIEQGKRIGDPFKVP